MEVKDTYGCFKSGCPFSSFLQSMCYKGKSAEKETLNFPCSLTYQKEMTKAFAIMDAVLRISLEGSVGSKTRGC